MPRNSGKSRIMAPGFRNEQNDSRIIHNGSMFFASMTHANHVQYGRADPYVKKHYDYDMKRNESLNRRLSKSITQSLGS